MAEEEGPQNCYEKRDQARDINDDAIALFYVVVMDIVADEREIDSRFCCKCEIECYGRKIVSGNNRDEVIQDEGEKYAVAKNGFAFVFVYATNNGDCEIKREKMSEKPKEWNKRGGKDALDEIVRSVAFVREVFEVKEMDKNPENTPENKGDKSLLETFFEKSFCIVAIAVVNKSGAGNHEKDWYGKAANRLNNHVCIPADIWCV